MAMASDPLDLGTQRHRFIYFCPRKGLTFVVNLFDQWIRWDGSWEVFEWRETQTTLDLQNDHDGRTESHKYHLFDKDNLRVWTNSDHGGQMLVDIGVPLEPEVLAKTAPAA